MSVNVDELLAFPRDDRAELAQMLIESLDGEFNDEFSQEQLEELRRYVAEYRADPGDTLSLEEVESLALPND